MSTIVAHVVRARRGLRLSLWGLTVGILGLLIQWIAEPAKFFPFPPGIAVIAVFGVLTACTARHWWAPVFAVLISLWIVVGGLAAGQLTPNLASGNGGTVAGTVIMSLGLTFAAITGGTAILGAWRARFR